MPVIVEMEGNHSILADEIELELICRIFGELVDFVLVHVKRRLMSDHHVLPRSRSPLHDIKRRHHGCGDTLDGRIR